MSNNNNNTNNNADQKLIHLVKKFLPFRVDGTTPNVDYIVQCLRTQHREYQRKEMGKLRSQVQKILQKQQRQQQQDDSNDAMEKEDLSDDSTHDKDINKKKNRKRALEEAAAEDDYENNARIHDEQRNRELQNSSMLNAGLVERYRKISQERDAQARATAAAEAAAAAATQATETPASASTGKETTATPKPGSSKLKRSKKTGLSSRRNGSSGGGLDPLEGGGPTVEAVPRPSERYIDLGGMEEILKQIRQLVEYPLVRPELYRYLGVDPPRGVLLRGPPGCGKTHLANAIAGQLGVPYFRVSAPELVSGMSGESEARIRDLFQTASDSAPSIIFMDELDAIAPKRDDGGSSRGMEKRMVAQLLTSFDSLDPKNNKQHAPVIVLGATNRADSIDTALRRAGRFDKEILLGVPDEDGRIGILKTMTKSMKLEGDFDFKCLARQTPGYVGADIRSLTKEAAVNAINRIFKDVLKDQKLPSETIVPSLGDDTMSTTDVPTNGDTADSMKVTPLTSEQMEPLFITMDDFMKAIPHVQPSSQREGFATVPGISWDDIGALSSIREELTLSVLEPIRNPEKFKMLGIPLPAGVMLYGPPGCGKTLLAKAIANESGANFISVKGPELLDKYVGESERSVRLVFERARQSSPCVVFFDELDSLCRKRGSEDGGGGGSGVSERVVNQLLTEMDGLESRRNVFVIAATNRPELIDPAMMRP